MIDNFRPRVVINPSPTPPTPTPTWDLLYNWDFTDSVSPLVDTEQGETLDTDHPNAVDSNGFYGEWRFPITLLEPGYAVEIYFGSTSFQYQEEFTFICVDGTNDEIAFSIGFTDSTPWGITCVDYTGSGIENSYQIIEQGTIDMFDNSKIRLEVTETANHNLIWTLYQDDVQIGQTPEYASDNVTPFITYPNASIVEAWCDGYAMEEPETSRVTALKIYQLE